MLGAFTTGLEEAQYGDEDDIIFCHDDIEVIMTAHSFNAVLDNYLGMANTGVVGVAGCASLGILNDTANWFSNAYINGQYDFSHGGGLVFHGTTIKDMRASYYGFSHKAVLLDGVFLAAKGATVRSVSFKSPNLLKSKWHNYDSLLTFQTFKSGKDNRIAPIILLHKSHGDYAREEYHEDSRMFMKLFAQWLPAKVVVD